MLNLDEDALLCDFAQYYHIYDLMQFGVRKCAILAYGLPDESRIKRLMSDSRITVTEMLLASIKDDVAWLVWANSADAKSNANRPKSVVKALMKREEDTDTQIFASAEDFELARARMLKGE